MQSTPLQFLLTRSLLILFSYLSTDVLVYFLEAFPTNALYASVLPSCLHCICLFCMIFTVDNIKRLVSVRTKCVYCEVGSGVLYKVVQI